MTLRTDPTLPPRRCRLRAAWLVALALGSQCGCTREFFREWANQDASEAIFEKSRDPRWRLDLFSVDPPALSRFADPYDPDTPPAPPDDFATQALSPVPQWPDNRLMIPAEGTGYLDMLDTWQRERDTGGTTDWSKSPGTLPPGQQAKPRTPATPTTPEPAPSPPPPTPSPFAPEGNSGPPSAPLSPTPVPGSPGPNPPSANTVPPQARAHKWDLGVRLAAFQQTGIPAPAPPSSDPSSAQPQPPRDLPTPPIGMDPNPINTDLSQPANPRPDLTPEQYRASEAMGSEMAGILIPEAIEFNEAEAAGLPRNYRPYYISLEDSFRLALINARAYQFQLENIYLASLAVTLQRFAFQPQFYAGMSPLTGVAGGAIPSPLPLNQFIYRTRETGSPISSLNLGTVAGVGKVFNSGARLLMGFANSVVFNFLGKNSRQPTVQSFLPLTLTQPFLRGGGRAFVLEPLTQAERTLLYQIRSFAKFRQEFVVATLVGGTFPNFGSTLQVQGFSGGSGGDAVIGFLNVLQDIQQLENDKKNIAAFEQLLKVYTELIQGEASGLTQLQVDQVASNLQSARLRLVNDRTAFRNALDQFKMQMGVPTDVPLTLDRALSRPFKEVFDGVDEWQSNPKRDLDELPGYAAKLPNLRDVIIDGRSCLAVYNGKDDEDDLEELLLASERVAFEHRLDLMNARAALYDAWRQIRFTANQLKGAINLTLTNQFLTPPATNNPFAFVEQAKQFSLVLNTELPLVRVAERNAFRTALITYQRQRRGLQQLEDQTKYQLRFDIRNLHQWYLTYEINRRNFVLTIRQKDQAFEQIIAPPQQAAAGGGGTAQASLAATQTSNLINFQTNLITIENALVTAWLQYETWRLSLYRDLGTLPYDEWEAFHELFPPDYNRPGTGVAPASTTTFRDGGPARSETAGEPEVARR